MFCRMRWFALAALLLLKRPAGATKPSAELVSFSKSFRQDGEIRLFCNAESGSQPLQFDWAFNDLPLKPSQQLTIFEMSSESSALVLKGARAQHSGVYSCRVSNRFGQAAATFRIDVQGRLPIASLEPVPGVTSTNHPIPTSETLVASGADGQERRAARRAETALRGERLSRAGPALVPHIKG